MSEDVQHDEGLTAALPQQLTEDEAWEYIAERIDSKKYSPGLCIDVSRIAVYDLIDYPLVRAMEIRIMQHMSVDGEEGYMYAFDWADWSTRIIAALFLAEEVRSEIEDGIYVVPK